MRFSSSSSSNVARRLFYLLPTVLVLLAYGPAVRYGFIGLDDTTYVEVNPWIQRGLSWESVRWAFTHAHEAYWIPLTWIGFMADVAVWGHGPHGHHVTNLLLHALNVNLLMLLLMRLGVRSRWALPLACVYALHPVNVEPVVWITGRKDLLCAAFWLGTVLIFDAAEKRRWLIATIGCAFAVMAKPLAMALPALLLMMAPRHRTAWHKQALLLLPAFGIAAGSAILAFHLQADVGATKIPTIATLLQNAVNVLMNGVAYGLKIIWPVNLGPEYAIPAFSSAQRIAGSAVAVTVIALSVWAASKKRQLAFGLLWFGIALLPVIGFLQVGTVSVADRFLYVPMMGLALTAGALLNDVPQARQMRWTVLLVIWVIALFVQTVKQRALWRSPVALFGHAVALSPNHALAHHYLGAALVGEGRYIEARAQFEAAIRLNPRHAEARVNLAVNLMNDGAWASADEQLASALEIKPDLPEAFFNRALLRRLQNRPEAARADLRRVLQLPRVDSDLRLAACIELARDGGMDEAYSGLIEWLETQPQPDLARVQLSAYLETAGVRALAERLRGTPMP